MGHSLEGLAVENQPSGNLSVDRTATHGNIFGMRELLGDPATYVKWHRFNIMPQNPPLMKRGVYLALHIETAKPYVGAAQCIFSRLRQHSWGSQQYFHNAIKKEGHTSFIVQPIYISLSDNDDLMKIEADLIADYDAIDNGYNICAAGGRVGPYGEAFSRILSDANSRPDRVQRVRQRMLDNWADPVWREKQEKLLEESRNDPGAKERHRQAMARIGADPQVRKKRGISISKTLAIPEIRDARLAALSILWNDPVIRERNKTAVAAAVRSPESRMRRSRTMKTLNEDPIFREKSVRLMKEGAETPEAKARWRAAMVPIWGSPEFAEEASRRSSRVWRDPVLRKKTTQAIKDALHSPEVNPKLHKRWITDGTTDLRLDPDLPLPEGWVYGRLVKPAKDKRWITDGSTSRRLYFASEIPDGWRAGRIYHRSNAAIRLHAKPARTKTEPRS